MSKLGCLLNHATNEKARNIRYIFNKYFFEYVCLVLYVQPQQIANMGFSIGNKSKYISTDPIKNKVHKVYLSSLNHAQKHTSKY